MHPLELLVLVGSVEDLEPGACRYHPGGHALEKTAGGDQRALLAGAAQGRSWVRYAALEVVFATVYERTTRNYGERGIRYVHMEAGHASQNLFLQAQALGLGSVVVGAFDDGEVAAALELAEGHAPTQSDAGAERLRRSAGTVAFAAGGILEVLYQQKSTPG